MCHEARERLACLISLPKGEMANISTVLPKRILHDTLLTQAPVLPLFLDPTQVGIEVSGCSCHSLELYVHPLPFTFAMSHVHSLVLKAVINSKYFAKDFGGDRLGAENRPQQSTTINNHNAHCLSMMLPLWSRSPTPAIPTTFLHASWYPSRYFFCNVLPKSPYFAFSS